MRKSLACLLLLSVLVSSCATAPTECPRLPAKPVLGQPGPSFLDRTQSFLSGKLPEPISYELTSKPAPGGLKK